MNPKTSAQHPMKTIKFEAVTYDHFTKITGQEIIPDSGLVVHPVVAGSGSPDALGGDDWTVSCIYSGLRLPGTNSFQKEQAVAQAQRLLMAMGPEIAKAREWGFATKTLFVNGLIDKTAFAKASTIIFRAYRAQRDTKPKPTAP